MRGLERRIEAGLDPAVPSVASLFVSRWDVAVADQVPAELRNRLGIAVGKRAYRAYRELLDSERWQRLANEGARPQRLLWASTGTKDPDASDVLYVEALAAPLHGQHDAREDACSPSPTTARSASRCPPTAATPRRCWPSSRPPGRRRRAGRAPPARGRGRRSSRLLGRSCSTRSLRSASRLAA